MPLSQRGRTKIVHPARSALAGARESARAAAQRYQTALLQQAAQVVTSCLHVEALSTSESARVLVTRTELAGRPSPPPP